MGDNKIDCGVFGVALFFEMLIYSRAVYSFPTLCVKAIVGWGLCHKVVPIKEASSSANTPVHGSLESDYALLFDNGLDIHHDHFSYPCGRTALISPIPSANTKKIRLREGADCLILLFQSIHIYIYIYISLSPT